MRIQAIAFFITALSLLFPTSSFAASYGDNVKGMTRLDGLVPTYLDHKGGRVLLALPKADASGESLRVIYAEYLKQGLGSNPVNLDRSQLNGEQLVSFKRYGNKVLMEALNTRYRASNTEAEKNAVKDSFASSVMWSGQIIAEAKDGSMLVDFSSFIARDSHNISARLKRSKQGAFRFSKDLSAVDVGASLAFPKNIELEGVVTFTGTDAGAEVRSTTPHADHITLKVHHSFIALPEDGFEPRAFDARTGVLAMPVLDYSAPLDEQVLRYIAPRFRLEKKDPTAKVSEVVKPIVFYVDHSVPEPVRSALVEGGNWWATAFEKAGFKNAYRVEVLPKDAHPLDARYSVVNWVHRETRGWSYGGSVVDPRTGEIIKGNVLLGSLRVRQDRMIFEGLLGADTTGSGDANDPEQVALARIRQLSAHEIGHALGFAHNMAASTVMDRSSVMDYPAPRIGLTADNQFDLSDAYGVGMGAWDNFSVDYLYGGADEAAIRRGYQKGLIYVTDPDSRTAGMAHPSGILWDNGSDGVAALAHTLKVRRLALDRFGLDRVREGQNVSDLAKVMVPIYLLHRYEIEGAAKQVGGMTYQYSRRGDGLEGTTILPKAKQMAAVDVLMAAVTPESLALSSEVLSVLSPRHRNYGETPITREMFNGRSNPSFDLHNAADVASNMVMKALFHAGRISRLVNFEGFDNTPTLEDVLSQTTQAVMVKQKAMSARDVALSNIVKARYVAALSALANGQVSQPVSARVNAHLKDLARSLVRSKSVVDQDLATRIRQHIENPKPAGNAGEKAPDTPPGSPIGSSMDSGWHHDTADLLVVGQE